VRTAGPGIRAKRATSDASLLEDANPDLKAALAEMRARPTPVTLRRVAEAYFEAGVLDLSYDYATAALRLSANDAGAFALRARIWRRWGFPSLAIPDAHRAVHFAPNSPEAHGTLGTVFEALGRPADAARCYSRALELDPGAAYARGNLERLGKTPATSSPR
jgi:tetratricopeptide (TPR) repeat protein